MKANSALRMISSSFQTIAFLTFVLVFPGCQSEPPPAGGLDILHYDVSITPSIEQAYVEGEVSIQYHLPPSDSSLVLKAGDLTVNRVDGDHVSGFAHDNNRLVVYLSERSESNGELRITYNGHPRRGLFFDRESSSAHTVFFTEYWMVSNDVPGDKATISLAITVDEEMDCLANGVLVRREVKGSQSICHWQQTFESPAYTYGFAIGEFNRVEQEHGQVTIASLGIEHSDQDLEQIFRYTPDMMTFFEGVSGIDYDQDTYSQILLGDSYQELSGWSLLRDSYGEMVLADSTETNLISHELAHQWWGNRITCATWSHFWLNEAFATFMSAAFNEHRFGREKYESDIQSYHDVYTDLLSRGEDRSLVFQEWSNPARDERNLVYFKGAYVLHLLRESMGEDAFWAGVKAYSTQYFDQIVTTQDFQEAMEASSGMDLELFFNEWVYAAAK